MKVKQEIFEATKERVRRGGKKAKIRPTEFVITSRTAEEWFDLIYICVELQSEYRERKYGKLHRGLPKPPGVTKLCKKFLTDYKKLKMKEPKKIFGDGRVYIKKRKKV